MSSLVLLALGILSACNGNSIYEENHDFPAHGWESSAVPTFDFEIKETDAVYNVYYNIRNGHNYAFQNIYINYSLEDTVGNLISKDLHNMTLFDPRSGKSQGSGIGDMQDHQLLALENIQFDTTGIYRMKLQQYMRRDTLKDIYAVGIKVEKADQKDYGHSCSI